MDDLSWLKNKHSDPQALAAVGITRLRYELRRCEVAAEQWFSTFSVKNHGILTQALVDAASQLNHAYRDAEQYREELTRRGCKVKEWIPRPQIKEVADWFNELRSSPQEADPWVPKVPDLPVSPTRASHRLPHLADHPGGEWYTIAQLARRWQCSESSARRVLQYNGCLVLDLAVRGRKGMKRVRKSTVERLEARKIKRLR
jgi:hypothetical protein